MIHSGYDKFETIFYLNHFKINDITQSKTVQCMLSIIHVSFVKILDQKYNVDIKIKIVRTCTIRDEV